MAHTSQRGIFPPPRRAGAPVPHVEPDAGSYRLGQRLGAGSTGEIYEATHPSAPGPLAVKVLRPGLAQVPEAVKAFLSDVMAVASLHHPSLVQVVDSGVLPQDGRPYVVMERLDGRPLETRIAGGGPLPAREVAAIVRALAGALQAAHERGVVHCELHPGNVFLAAMDDGAELPKILDFGVVRLRNAGGGDAGVGADEARYMAPEQAMGRSEEIDGRTDEFALAALAYRLLCGADAFRGHDAIAVLYQVVHEPPAPMSTHAPIDPRVEAVVLRGLSKRPADRYRTAREFAAALDEAGQGKSAPARTWDKRDSLRDTLVDEEARRARAPSGLDPAPDSVLHDEPAWIDGDDDFADLGVPRRQGWKIAGFLCGFTVVCAGAALLAGWQPPLRWRQSRVWHTLHLPRAAETARASSEPARSPAIVPLPSPAPASPPPVTGEASPAPSAPATAGAGISTPPPAIPAPASEAPPTTAQPAGEAPPAQAAALPAQPAAALPAQPAAAPPAKPAAKPPAAAAAAPRHRHHAAPRENVQLRGMVWSEKEQRLVPADAIPPAPGAAPSPLAPRAAPVPPPPPRPRHAPGDEPLPLSGSSIGLP